MLPAPLHHRDSASKDHADAASLTGQVMQHERALMAEALRRHHGVLRRAAAELGMNRVTFGRKARQHGLLPEPVPQDDGDDVTPPRGR